jgi:hypothetical protein
VVSELFKDLPQWAGTVPQWGLFLVLCIAVVRTSPHWLETWSAMRVARSNRNAERIRELETQVRSCRAECDEKIANLHNEIYGLRTQRNAEQAGMLRAILSTIDSPALRKQLDLIESLEIGLRASPSKEDIDAKRS